MKRDLRREMRKIAAHLDIEIDENVFCDLLKAASFLQKGKMVSGKNLGVVKT